jgi:formyl-CoA transferase
MLGREDLLSDPDYDTRLKRSQQADTLDQMIVDWMKGKNRQEVFRETSEVWLLPTAPVLNLSEVLQDEQFAHRSLFQQVSHPAAGEALYPTFPFSMSETRPSTTRAPLLGEHTSEILGGRN